MWVVTYKLLIQNYFLVWTTVTFSKIELCENHQFIYKKNLLKRKSTYLPDIYFTRQGYVHCKVKCDKLVTRESSALFGGSFECIIFKVNWSNGQIPKFYTTEDWLTQVPTYECLSTYSFPRPIRATNGARSINNTFLNIVLSQYLSNHLFF